MLSDITSYFEGSGSGDGFEGSGGELINVLLIPSAGVRLLRTSSSHIVTKSLYITIIIVLNKSCNMLYVSFGLKRACKSTLSHMLLSVQ